MASYSRVNPTNPVNWDAPLNRGRVYWGLTIPGNRVTGASKYDLVRSVRGVFTGVSMGGAHGRPGGYGSIAYAGGTPQSKVAVVNDSRLQGVLGAFTTAAWVRRTGSFGGQNRGIFGRWNNTANQRCWLMQHLTTDKITCNVSVAGSASTAQVDGVTTLSANVWYYIMVVYVPSVSLTLYINGIQDAQQTISIPASLFNATARPTEGAFHDTDAVANYVGNVDDCSLWNRALSAREAWQSYQASRTGYKNELNWMQPFAMQAQAAAADVIAGRDIVVPHGTLNDQIDSSISKAGMLNAGTRDSSRPAQQILKQESQVPMIVVQW